MRPRLEWFVFLPVLAAAQDAGWQAGVAQAVITPREPVWLAGFGSRVKPSEGVLRDIHAKALALRDSTGALSILLTSDLVGFSKADVEAIAARAVSRHRVPRERLLVNCSHNHSAPVTTGVLPLYYDLTPEQAGAVERYSRWMMERVAGVIDAAVKDLSPAALSFEQGLAGFAVNRRRSRPGGRALPGPVDHDVPVLSVRAPNGRLRAVVFGYACHTTTLAGYQVSGDWAGFAQEAVQRAHPGAVALFVAGCGADSNPLPRYHGTAEALKGYSTALPEMYGRILAAAVELVLAGKMAAVPGPLKAAFGSAEVEFQPPLPRAELERRMASTQGLERREIGNLLRVLDRDGRLPASYPYPVQVWRFGSALTLVGLTGEPVVDYSHRFKARYGWDQTWVAGYNNELLAYIPSLRVLREGGYEGTEGMWEYGLPAPFAETTEERIAAKVDELYRSLR